MLKLILTFGLTLIIDSVLPAQTGKSGETSSKSVREEPKVTVTCQHLVINGSMTTLIGNVNIKAGDFEVKGATRALYDQENKKITVLGGKEFRGEGEVILHNTDRPGNRIEHVPGSRTIDIF